MSNNCLLRRGLKNSNPWPLRIYLIISSAWLFILSKLIESIDVSHPVGTILIICCIVLTPPYLAYQGGRGQEWTNYLFAVISGIMGLTAITAFIVSPSIRIALYTATIGILWYLFYQSGKGTYWANICLVGIDTLSILVLLKFMVTWRLFVFGSVLETALGLFFLIMVILYGLTKVLLLPLRTICFL